MMENAVAIYRHYFKPSDVLKEPYVILGANAVVADTDEEAKNAFNYTNSVIFKYNN